ncbi:glycoside hydrolase family 97 protein [Pelagicoccus mobilis]|uniref:Glycoside hydrolase family 97 catalytic domain-containing protein n=1 Tax=Pelagicoccus mobilis TaxID=415221 RepID=A0A934S0H8_9BACT|nr:glycoside hydrolase family 97 protein [Pelagicoccus mobilis]MBK1878940.1 glycoside hydrolase family 97 catalytic domain-containing protein [Pelagicoccus mobilis]
MKLRSATILVAGLAVATINYAGERMTSPSGNIEVEFDTDGASVLQYSVEFKGHEVVEPSRLGISIDGVDLGEGATIGAPRVGSVDETYETRGTDPHARNHYKVWTYPVTHEASGDVYSVEFRVYDDGVAYRYIVPGFETHHVDGEASSWKMIGGSKVWYFERLQGDWKLKSYAGEWLKSDIETLDTATPEPFGSVQGVPLVCDLPGDLGYAVLTKAATYNYSGMRLDAVGNRTVVANFTEGDAGFDVDGPVVTPWRATLLADDLNELVNSDFINNLNPAPDTALFADPSYIVPGRSAWSWESIGLGSPEDQHEFIDLAAEIGFEYSTVDDGWKDWDQPWQKMKELADHGKRVGVGVWLWVHSNDIDDPANDYQQMRDYFDKVVEAGVVGLKIDFMNGESKKLVDFEIAVLENSAKRRLVINFHGCHASTGEERTYPNELTREGIRGLEVNKHKLGPLPASHNAALSFTRFVVGQADYTPILFTNPGPTTWAHQLGTLVTFSSALQSYAEHPETMLRGKNVSLAAGVIRDMPVVWDETRVLEGSEIGELSAFARRSGDDWYVGVVNGGSQKGYSLDLSFLGKGRYQAEILSDDLDADPADVKSLGINQKATLKQWTTTVPLKREVKKVKSSQSIDVSLAEGGGFVAVFRK